MVGGNALAPSAAAPTSLLRPARQIVLKLHSRCDLSCDYCYVYTKSDDRWRTATRVMSRPVIDQLARRTAEHARAHALPSVDLILHGGEPLLAGPQVIGYAVRAVRAETRRSCGSATQVEAMMQTNGVRLTDDMLALARDLHLGIGVSLDGGRQAHDRHRRSVAGGGSYARVAAGLGRLTAPAYRHLFRGLLCTVDLANDPLDCYQALLEFQPPAIDLLLPHGHWSDLPPGIDPTSAATRYADWLIAIFDRWYDSPVPETSIRLFASIMRTLAGGRPLVESLGGRPAEAVVIETDGALTRSDTLAAADVLAAGTGQTVWTARLDQAGSQLAPTLPTPCRPCPVRRSCGGGLPAHRYLDGAGFDHRSVYGPDLLALISHIRGRLAQDLERLNRAG